MRKIKELWRTNYIFFILISTFLPFLYSCSTLNVEKISKEEFHTVRNPQKKITLNRTRFGIPLRRFGRDLALVIDRPNVIGIGSIVNESPDKRIPAQFKQVIITSSAKLLSSPLAEKKIYIVDINTLTDFYSLVSRLIPSKRAIRIRIDGSVTEADKIIAKNFHFSPESTVGRGKGESDIGSSYESSAGAEVITLDLQASTNGVILPLGYSSCTLTIYQRERGAEFSLFSRYLGFSLGGTYEVNDSKSYALRLLTEFSLIQILGRIFLVPYWHCFHNTITQGKDINSETLDQIMIQYLQENWNLKAEQEKWKEYSRIVKIYLDYYVKKPVNIDPFTPEGLKNLQLIVKALSHYFGYEDPLSFETYFKIFDNMPFCGFPRKEDLFDLLNSISFDNETPQKFPSLDIDIQPRNSYGQQNKTPRKLYSEKR